jgi:cell fate regulator YaaT (PSP1 superfamily)
MRKIGAWSSGDTIKIDIEQRREFCVNFRQDFARYCLNEIKKALLTINPTNLVDKDRPLRL